MLLEKPQMKNKFLKNIIIAAVIGSLLSVGCMFFGGPLLILGVMALSFILPSLLHEGNNFIVFLILLPLIPLPFMKLRYSLKCSTLIIISIISLMDFSDLFSTAPNEGIYGYIIRIMYSWYWAIPLMGAILFALIQGIFDKFEEKQSSVKVKN